MTKEELAKTIADVLVKENEDCDEIVEAFRAFTAYLQENESKLFEPVLELATYDMEAENPVVETEYFDYKGVMLFDITYGKPANKSAYLYRCKGIKTFITNDGELSIFGPYSVMDNKECWFQHELYESHKLEEIDSYEDIDYCLRYVGDDEVYQNLSASQRILIALQSIKETLPKGHFVEYVLLPPDYHRSSEVTQNVLDLIWSRLLVGGSRKQYTDIEIQTATKKLIDLDISPDFRSFVSLISFELSNDIEHIKNVVSYMSRVSIPDVTREIKEFNNKSDDIIELKPSLGFITLNIRALVGWVKRVITNN
ncbi:hypothetical protein K0I59_004076 [Vibrio vulnificus]|nr:hypothetical protein [Vibrio vulnificus]EIO3909580.1 hypothetical protein [Vibrio vulnificus]